MDLDVDWNGLFLPTVHLGEIFLRGTLVYLFVFFLFRFMRRQAGQIGMSDLIVVVLIADAASNAMSAEYRSFTEGALLIATIVFWDFFLDWLSFHVPATRRILRAGPLLLIKDGRLLRRNMKREMIQENELLAQLRENGVDSVADVKEAHLEENGHLSVIPKSGS
jgi:uncharacterized membrane protein YcaP (DUF421 family)